MAAPQKYREEAKLLREKAMLITHTGDRKTILQLASLYERLASRPDRKVRAASTAR
jgi:hypothetical protein